jgi:transcriptional regulator with GAF, ATPase, and Fis domain
MTQDRALAARFAEISDDLLRDPSEEVTFEAVVRRAVDVVPGCDACSVTLRKRRRQAETVASTDPAVDTLDAAQYSLGEGPCLTAAFEQGLVVSADAAHDGRWPQWSSRAGDLGVGSALAIRLHTQRETLGALNLYSRTRHAFDDEAVDIAVIFAAHATHAMAKARLVTGLHTAMESRHSIGIAQGVLAVRYGITYERAFEVLHRYSNDTNTKLRDVAALVIEQRNLPSRSSDPNDPTETVPELTTGAS